jgi:plasmid stabilization system protein ParE
MLLPIPPGWGTRMGKTDSRQPPGLPSQTPRYSTRCPLEEPRERLRTLPLHQQLSPSETHQYNNNLFSQGKSLMDLTQIGRKRVGMPDSHGLKPRVVPPLASRQSSGNTNAHIRNSVRLPLRAHVGGRVWCPTHSAVGTPVHHGSLPARDLCQADDGTPDPQVPVMAASCLASCGAAGPS